MHLPTGGAVELRRCHLRLQATTGEVLTERMPSTSAGADLRDDFFRRISSSACAAAMRDDSWRRTISRHPACGDTVMVKRSRGGGW